MVPDAGADRAPQFAAALAALNLPPHSPGPVDALARHLPHAPPLSLYASLSQLRTAQAVAVLHALLTLPATPVTTAAAVRAACALRHTPELARACDDLAGRGGEVWSLRPAALLAVLAGRRARNTLPWGGVFGSVAAGTADEEARVAAAFVLGDGREAQVRFGLPVQRWETEGAEAADGEGEVGLWRELAWVRFASECILGQGDAAFVPRDGVVPPAFEGGGVGLEGGEAAGGVPEAEWVVVEGVRLRRRRPVGGGPGGTAELGRPDAMEDVGESMGAGAGAQEFVLTAGVRETSRMVAAGLADAKPVLLDGPPGCGKSALLSQLARMTAPRQCKRDGTFQSDEDIALMRVQMDCVLGASGDDEFISLIGAVVPLPQGGGFRWRPGPIGAAMQKGAWLVLENLGAGSAGSGVATMVAAIAALHPGDKFDAPGRGVPIVVQPGFAVLATRTSAVDEPVAASDWEPPGTWPLWRQVVMPALSDEELQVILRARFPAVSDCTERVMNSVSAVQSHLCQLTGRPLPGSRSPNMRDAVKVCRRLESLRLRPEGDILTPETAVMETLDVLVNWELDAKSREMLRFRLATAWSLGRDTVKALASEISPTWKLEAAALRIGRARLVLPSDEESRSTPKRRRGGKLALNGHTLRLLERIGRCAELNESVLLSGESGSGKTACVQELASRLQKNLVIVNMSRNSDIGDLLGGFRPVDLGASVAALARLFETAFCGTLSRDKNERFLAALRTASRSTKYHERALKLMRGAVKAMPSEFVLQSDAWEKVLVELARLEGMVPSTAARAALLPVVPGGEADYARATAPPTKRRKMDQPELCPSDKSCPSETVPGKSPLGFEFSDGVLVTAMRNGYWVLLDELNLAPAEVLEQLVGLLDHGCVALANSSADVVTCASGFALFGAMNPPNDAGKKHLPLALRSRFTEFFVDDCLSEADLTALALKRLFGVESENDRGRGAEERQLCVDVAEFYLRCRDLAENGHLADANGKKVRYSLRSLSRMLDFASAIARGMPAGVQGYRRALYEGALIAFVTPLPQDSRKVISDFAYDKLVPRGGGSAAQRKTTRRKGMALDDLCDVMRPPANVPTLKIAGFHMQVLADAAGVGGTSEATGVRSDATTADSDGFIVTDTVRSTLRDVCRALVVGAPRLPILLQGPTAAGKTSLVTYLARLTGKRLIRINNHEHTDVSEYLGSYVSTEEGVLQFQEGPIVQAARSGDWVVLDELNLAPPEVLEALNRLLDDNREVRIPETGEVVRARAGFTIFATQNPPGLYGGRKELSRAFRGRFVEVQVDDLPDTDLKEILGRKSNIPASFAARMIAAMRELQVRRRSSQIFSGKSGFVTARDLFRWASRKPGTREELAVEGFFLLGERSRLPGERDLVREVLTKHMNVDPEVLSDSNLYNLGCTSGNTSLGTWGSERSVLFDRIRAAAVEVGVALTPAMRRMLILLAHSVMNSEPALLVGGTGSGKTTACSVIARALDVDLLTVNCHRHSEASDFVGSYRPASRVDENGTRRSKLFEWIDGPLVRAMKDGSGFLVDEINMADDAVVERLNSVLETERTLLLSERGSSSSSAPGSEEFMESVTAAPSFRAFATMNPGGDFGKKELSPALRNRFTELWISPPDSTADYEPVIMSKVKLASARLQDQHRGHQLMEAGEAVVNFVGWNMTAFGTRNALKTGHLASSVKSYQVTLRDASAWSQFIVEASERYPDLPPAIAFAHGARLVILDGLTVGSASAAESKLGARLWSKVLELVPEQLRATAAEASFEELSQGIVSAAVTGDSIGFGPFRISCVSEGSRPLQRSGFSFGASSTIRNCSRIARAMALHRRPILLEGPPGAGKSSVVEAVAAVSGSKFTRVNLSEHTEMSDLIGGFIPSAEAGVFKFRCGPLLTAMEYGHWILLDELNLASQSVLEGLNGILDHRCAIFVPELVREVLAVGDFRVFAAQNAAHQGGGRRGLPQSFLNRFTRVNVEAPMDVDIEFIAAATHPGLDKDVVKNIVKALRAVSVALAHLPLQVRQHDMDALNLRDALRWCDLMTGVGDGDYASFGVRGTADHAGPGVFFDAVILQRLGSLEARDAACKAFHAVFGCKPVVSRKSAIRIAAGSGLVRIGRVLLPRQRWMSEQQFSSPMSLVQHQHRPLEALALAVSAGWPAIVTSGEGGACDAADAREIVHKLAILCGQRVVELRVGGGSDSADLLGGYMQCDASREVRLALWYAQTAADTLLVNCGHFAGAADVVSTIEKCRGDIYSVAKAWDVNDHRPMEDLGLACDLVESLNTIVSQYDSFRSCAGCNSSLTAAKNYVTKAMLLRKSSAGAFEWRWSTLIEAAERGDWLLIPDADRCPPAVLDRLNPLLERPAVQISSAADVASLKQDCGRLLLAEAPPNEDGTPAFVCPHPNFRVFMTVDRRKGYAGGKGLSKALRNRSMEISLSERESSESKAGTLALLGCPSGSIDVILPAWNSYTTACQLSHALSERALYRLADMAKVFYGRTPLAGSVEAGHEAVRLLLGQVSFRPPSLSCKEDMLLRVHDMAIGCNSLLASRDVCVVRRVAEVYRTVTMSSNVADPFGADGMKESLEPTDGTRYESLATMYYSAEACLAASVTADEFLLRMEILNSFAEACSDEAASNLIRDAVEAAQPALETLCFTSTETISTALSRSKVQAPVDPFYGMDEESVAALARVCDDHVVACLEKVAAVFRMQLSCCGPLLRVWSNARQGQGPNSFLSHSMEASNTCAVVPNSSNRNLAVLATHYYPMMSTFAKFCEAMPGLIPASVSCWTVAEEEKWRRLLYFAKRLAHLGTLARALCEDDFVNFVALLRLLLDTVPDAVCKGGSYEPLHAVLEIAKKSFESHLFLQDHVWVAKQALPCPRRRESVELEGSVVRLLSELAMCDLSISQRLILAQALVSLSSRAVEDRSVVMTALVRVPDAVRESIRMTDATRAIADVRVATGIWKTVVDVSASTAMCSALVVCKAPASANYSPLTVKFESRLKLLDDALQVSVLSGNVGVFGMLPFQRLAWLEQAGEDGETRKDGDFESRAIEMHTANREGLIAFLRSHCHLDLEEVRGISCMQGVGLSTVHDGSEMTVASIWEHEKTWQRGHLWTSTGAIANASISAYVLLAGAIQRTDLYHGPWSSSRGLLVMSLVQLVVSVEPDTQSLFANLDASATCDLSHIGTVLSDVCDVILARQDKIGDLFRTSATCLRDALRQSAAYRSDRDRAPYERLVAAYGKAWAEVGLARLSIYCARLACVSTIDPAKVAAAEVAEWDACVSDACAKVAGYEAVSSSRPGGINESATGPILTGDETVSRCRKGAAIARVGVAFRPADKASFAVLCDIVRRLHVLCVDEGHAAKVVGQFCALACKESPATLLPEVESHTKVILEALSSAAERLEIGGELCHLRDLGGEAALAVRELQFGISVTASAAKRVACMADSGAEMRKALCDDLLQFPRAAVDDSSTLTPEKLVALSSDMRMNGDALSTALRLLSIHSNYIGPPAVRSMLEGIGLLVSTWKNELVRSEEDEVVTSSLYKMKLAVEEASQRHFGFQSAVEDLEAEEADFQQTFSVAATEPADCADGELESGAETRNIAPESPPDEGLSSKPSSVRAPDASQSWQLYKVTVLRCLNLHEEDAKEALRDRGDVMCRVLATCASQMAVGRNAEERNALFGASADMTSSAATLAASFRLSAVCGAFQGELRADMSGKARAYNFYADSNTVEALNGAEALSSLARMASEVQSVHFNDTGGHPVLQGVLIAAEQAARASSATPLSVLVVGLENVLRKVDEWQQHFATKEMRMEKHVHAVALTASRWRKLEIASWPELLESRATAFEAKGHKWFFYVYDALFAGDVFSEEPPKEVLSTVDQFIRAAPCGEFEVRLEMVTYIAMHISAMTESEGRALPQLALFLRGLAAFYSQFLPDVKEALSSSRRPLEAQMKEYASLAKWDKKGDLGVSVTMDRKQDRELEFNRLKAASESTRRKLHKVCKEMDSTLRVPVSQVILGARERIGLGNISQVDQAGAKFKHPGRVNANMIVSFVATTCGQSKPIDGSTLDLGTDFVTGRLSRLVNLRDRMSRVAKAGLDGGLLGKQPNQSTLESLRLVIVGRLRALQSGPKVGVQTKAKALADLLKALKVLGLSPHPNTVPEDRKMPSFWLATPDLLVGGGVVSDAARYEFHDAAKRYTRLTEAAAGSNLHKDLSRREATQCVSFCGHFLHLSAMQRRAFHDTLMLTREVTFYAESLGAACVSARRLAQVVDAESATVIILCGEKVAALRNFRSRLESVSFDMELAASHASQIVKSVGSHLDKCQQTASSVEEALKTHQVRRASLAASRTCRLLSEAASLVRKTVDGFPCRHAVSNRKAEGLLWENDSFVVTEALLEEAAAVFAATRPLLSALERLYADSEAISDSNLAKTTLRPVVDLVSRNFDDISRSNDEVARSGRWQPRATSLQDVAKQAELVVNTTLVGTQLVAGNRAKFDGVGTVTVSENSSDDRTNDMIVANMLQILHEETLNLVSSTNLQAVAAETSALYRMISTVRHGNDSVGDIESLARATGVFVRHFLQNVVKPLLAEQLAAHLDGLRLLATLESLFVGICMDGYCRPPDEEANDTCIDENLQTHEGTGFGDVGDGDTSLAQDVSEQIEDEEQLLGQGNDEGADREEQNAQHDDEAKDHSGFEMTTDFDGELEDVPEGKRDDEGGGLEDKDEPPPEKHMWHGDEAGADLVDEQLWDEENDGGEDDRKSAAQLEQGENIDGAGHGPEADLVAREQDEELDRKPKGEMIADERGEKHAANEVASPGEGDTEGGDDDDSKSVGDAGGGTEHDIGDDEENNSSAKQPKLKMDELGNGDESHDERASDDEVTPSDSKDGGGAGTLGDDEDIISEDQGDEKDSSLSGNAIGDDSEEASNPENMSKESIMRDSDDTAGAGGDDGDAEMPENLVVNPDDHDEKLSEGSGSEGGDGFCDPLDAEAPNGEDVTDDLVDDVRHDPSTYGEEAVDAKDETAKSRSEDADMMTQDGATRVDIHDSEIDALNRSKNSVANAADAAPGIAGGEMVTAASDRPQQGERAHAGSAGAIEGNEAAPEESNTPNCLDSGVHRPGGRGDDDEANQKRKREVMEPNPHRQVATDVLLDQWERRFELLASSTTDLNVENDDNNGTRGQGGPFEFIEVENVDGIGDGDNTEEIDADVALGPATDDQHRPLDESQAKRSAIEELSGDDLRIDEAVEPDVDGGKQEASRRRGLAACAVVDDVDRQDLKSDFDAEVPEDDGHPDSADVLGAENVSAAETALKALEERYENPAERSRDKQNLETLILEEASDEDAEERGDTVAREDVLEILDGQSPQTMDEKTACEVWQRLESLTSSNAAALCEQLRLVLEPTLATGLAGDFRTGKRLNMRRVLEFVASDFRRDRIWLRRVRPEKRSYDVLIAIDDSESMADSGAGPLALEAMSLLTSALAKLEVGRVAVATFGARTHMVRGFDEPLPMGDRAGGHLLSGFTFAQKETNANRLLEFVQDRMCGPGGCGGRGDGAEDVKLAFVVSDGRLSEREEVRRQIRELQDARVLVAFVVLDIVGGDRKSIFDVKRVEYEANGPGKISVTPYMDKFPVEFYSVIRDVSVLPATLADALRQWFEVVNGS